MNQIKYITSQNFSNIEILIYIEKLQRKNYILLLTEFQNLINENILHIYNKNNNSANCYCSTINLVKGL